MHCVNLFLILVKDEGPSPTQYTCNNFNNINHHKKSPSYSFSSKFDKNYVTPGPGPKFSLPTTIGPNVPDKKSSAAYSM